MSPFGKSLFPPKWVTSFMDSPLRGFLGDYIGWIFLFFSCRHKNDYIVHTKYLGKNYSSNSDSWIGNQYFSGKCTPFCLFALLLKEDQNSIFYQEIKNTMRFAKKIWHQKFNQKFYRMICSKKNPFPARMNGIDEIDCLYVQESHLGTLCIVPK